MALFLAAILVFNVDGIVDGLRDHLELVAMVPRAEGVRVGSAVWVAGVESGRVTRIAFLGSSAETPAGRDSATVALHLRLDDDTRAVITRGSDVRALRLRFVGQPIIEVSAGEPGDAPVEDGDTLYARPHPDPLELLDRGMRLPGAVDSLLGSVRAIQAMAGDRAPELRRLSDRVAAVSAAASTLAGEMEGGTLGRLMNGDAGEPTLADRVATLRARVGELQEAGARLAGRYADGAAPDGLPAAMSRAMGRADRIQEELATLQARMEDGGGFLPRMQRDSAVMVAVRGVQAQIDSLASEALSIGLRMVVP